MKENSQRNRRMYIPCIVILLILILIINPSQLLGVRIVNDIPKVVMNKIQRFLFESGLTLPSTPVIIYEAESLDEFHRLTGKTYSIGGVYHDFKIIIQPVDILKRKGVYYTILTHELLHWILYGLEEKHQEELIAWWLGLNKDENFAYNLYLNYGGNLAFFIRSHWKNKTVSSRR